MNYNTTKSSSMSSSKSTNSSVASLVRNRNIDAKLKKKKLCITTVAYEDSARNKFSILGPNISDMSLSVCNSDAFFNGDMVSPIIRRPNYSDHTVDIPLDMFYIPVGNETGGQLKMVTLREFLHDISVYTDNSNHTNLLLSTLEEGETKNPEEKEDKVILCSTQCCILPCTKEGDTDFNVQLYNYQSTTHDPAVMTIMVSNLGTSTQVLEDSREKLFFNDNGIAKNFNIQRLQHKRKLETGVEQEKVKSFNEMTSQEKMQNVLMVLQIPLVQKPRSQAPISLEDEYEVGCLYSCGGDYNELEEECSSAGFMSRSTPNKKTSIGMDMGVISTGMSQGTYSGTKDYVLKRDKRFPIRCTMQFYRVTDENNVDDSDINDIAEQLEQPYRLSSEQGSLVLETSGRKTEIVPESDDSDNDLGKLISADYYDDCW